MVGENGKTADMSQPPMAPSEFVEFTIGGAPIKVRVLTLFDLERTKPYIQSLSPAMDWISYSSAIVNIIAELTAPDEIGEPEATRQRLSKACSAKEALELGAALNELFIKSGIGSTGEDQAAPEPGTGMLMPSPPNSPSGESAPAIRSESSEP